MDVPAMTDADLALRRAVDAAEQVRAWIEKRDHRIVLAVQAGLSQREVARAVDLSHTAIQVIVRRAATE